MIDVSVRQKNACDRRVSRSVAARLQRRGVFDLQWHIRRCVNQKPAPILFGISANSDAGLRLRRNFARSRGDAVRTRTIPLRQTATGCAAENTDANQSELSQLIPFDQIAPA
jgi:hypothetical protein